MTAFEFLSVALSFVLGLAVTLLLTSLLAAVRARRETRMDWLPFVWAAYVLLLQFQFWWAIYELSALPEWSVATFAMLLLLAMILFLAGGLVLPTAGAPYPSDLAEYFRKDGKSGVVALAAYGTVAIAANAILFGTSLFSTVQVTTAVEVVLATIVAASPRRRVQVVTTALYGIGLALALVLATPRAY